MGKKTDAYSLAVDSYVYDSTIAKKGIEDAQDKIIAAWKVFAAAEQAHNRGDGNAIDMNRAFQDAQTFKAELAQHKADLQGHLKTLKTKTTEFEKYIKIKTLKVKLNPLN